MWKTQDCHFNKKIVTNGEGFSCPILETKCCINVKEVIFETEIDHMIRRLKEDILQISEYTIGWSINNAMKILGLLSMTMKRGEISQFDVSSSSLEISDGVSDSKSKNIKFTIVLELKDFNEVSPIWKLCDTEKYELALSHKNEGSKLFQDSCVGPAFNHYSLAIKYLITMNWKGGELEVDLKECKKLMCVCYLNLAACQLKYKNYDCVITNCCKALNLDGRNVKALYRRASAYKELGRNNDARSDLLQAKKHEPRNKVIQEMLQSLTVINVT